MDHLYDILQMHYTGTNQHMSYIYVTLKIDVGNKLLTETMRVLLKRKS